MVLLLQQTPHQPAQPMLLQPPTASPMSTRWFHGLQTPILPAHQLLQGTGRSIARYVQYLCYCGALPSLVCALSAVLPVGLLRLSRHQASMFLMHFDGQCSLNAVAALIQSCLQHFAASGLKLSAQSSVQHYSLKIPPPAIQGVHEDLHIGIHRVCVSVCSLKAPLTTSSPV